MRKLMAVAALLFGAAGADAAERAMWCSAETPERIVQVADWPAAFAVDGKPIKPEGIEHTECEDGTDVVVLVYKGRVFRPCQN